MIEHYELNSQFFNKTWKEIFILGELGFEKIATLLDYTVNPTAQNLDKILSRMDIHIEQFIINNKSNYIDCLLQFAKEKPYMYEFLYIIFSFKHLCDTAPKTDNEMTWQNPAFKNWSLDFINYRMAFISFQNTYLKETKEIVKYPTNLSFMNKRTMPNPAFFKKSLVKV